MHQSNSHPIKITGSTQISPPPCKGFTLLEILIAVAIIGIMVSISIPAYSHYIQKAKIVRCIAEIKLIETNISSFYSDYEEYPDTLDSLRTDTSRDPWGNPYMYLKIEGSGIKGKGPFRKDRFLNPLNGDYDLYSMGADGLSSLPLSSSKSLDDIVRANNGYFVGLASDF